MDLQPIIDQINPIISDLASKLAYKHLYDKYPYTIEVSGSMVEKYDATIHAGTIPAIHVNLDFVLDCMSKKQKPRLSYVITKMLENVRRMTISLDHLSAPADNIGIKREATRLTKNVRKVFVTDDISVDTVYTVTVSQGEVEVSLSGFNEKQVPELRRLAIIKLAEIAPLAQKEEETYDFTTEHFESPTDSIGIKALTNGIKYEFDIDNKDGPASGDNSVSTPESI
jgi:hypothetical protein